MMTTSEVDEVLGTGGVVMAMVPAAVALPTTLAQGAVSVGAAGRVAGTLLALLATVVEGNAAFAVADGWDGANDAGLAFLAGGGRPLA